MKQSYFYTTDLDHLDEAIEIAAEFNYMVHGCFPKDGAMNFSEFPVLIDLDSWVHSAEARAEVLDRILRSEPVVPVWVFSYHLEEDDIAMLRAHGIRCAKQVGTMLFEDLCVRV